MPEVISCALLRTLQEAVERRLCSLEALDVLYVGRIARGGEGGGEICKMREDFLRLVEVRGFIWRGTH